MRSFGGRFSEIVDPANLRDAMRRAVAGKVRRPAVSAFVEHAGDELERLREELLAGTYRPGPYVQFHVQDPKPRVISCAPFRDRVVHHALCGVCAPLLERRFIHDTFACRKGKGAHAAVRRAQEYCRRHRYVLRLDIAAYFDSVSHAIMSCLLERVFRESAVRDLWCLILTQAVPGRPEGLGLPIGNLTSQWMANTYLDGFDHLVREEWRVRGYVRYMDDMAFWEDDKEALWQVRDHAAAWLAKHRCLALKDRATMVVPVAEGVPFLGLRIFPGCLRFSRSTVVRSRAKLALRMRQAADGQLSLGALQDSARALVARFRFWGCGGLVRSQGEAYDV